MVRALSAREPGGLRLMPMPVSTPALMPVSMGGLALSPPTLLATGEALTAGVRIVETVGTLPAKRGEAIIVQVDELVDSASAMSRYVTPPASADDGGTGRLSPGGEGV